ncbi:MAG: glycosyltransferase family 39 protein [Methanobacteriota archaeon]
MDCEITRRDYKEAFKHILFFFVSTRIILTIIGVISRILLVEKYRRRYQQLFTDRIWLNIWTGDSTLMYMRVAKDWYPACVDCLQLKHYAFSPLYPLTMRILETVTKNYFTAGFIVSNISIIISAYYLYKIVRLKDNHETALRSVKYLFVFPAAFMLSAVHTEALFLTLLLMTFYYAKLGRWWLAGFTGFLLALTRIQGAFTIIPLLYIYLDQRNFSLKNIDFKILYVGLIGLGLVATMVYSHQLTGDYFTFIHAKQKFFGHEISNPVTILGDSLQDPSIDYFINGWVTVIAIVFLIVFHRKIENSYLLLALILIIIPLIGGLSSVKGMARFILVIFPFFIILAHMGENKRIDELMTITFALLQGFLMALWATRFNIIL